MALQIDGIVLRNERIKPIYFLLTIHCPPIANVIKPGQFIMLKVSDDFSPLLRRPFSVYKSYPLNHPDKKKRGCFLILYKKIGEGTCKMTEFKEGQQIGLIGPLGIGFSFPSLPSSTEIILIGGGVGIVSLYSLAEVLGSPKMFVFIGGKTKGDILCEEDFKKLNGSKIFIATEDGSFGYRGTVIDLFLSQRKRFKKTGRGRSQYIYSCGPAEMLKELARAIKFKGVVCQVSLEARMGCGFGACWGCVVKTNDPVTPYQRVCKEGPVFNLKDIFWE
jgi:dihydroorotate dehydrogenase electron transfer subunit